MSISKSQGTEARVSSRSSLAGGRAKRIARVQGHSQGQRQGQDGTQGSHTTQPPDMGSRPSLLSPLVLDQSPAESQSAELLTSGPSTRTLPMS